MFLTVQRSEMKTDGDAATGELRYGAWSSQLSSPEFLDTPDLNLTELSTGPFVTARIHL